MCGYSCTGCGECRGEGKRRSLTPRGLCPACGALNGPRASRCAACGEPLPLPAHLARASGASETPAR